MRIHPNNGKLYTSVNQQVILMGCVLDVIVLNQSNYEKDNRQTDSLRKKRVVLTGDVSHHFVDCTFVRGAVEFSLLIRS
jgi:hypothetical protein